MDFNTINIMCKVISGVKDNGSDADIIYDYNLKEPPGYMINSISTIMPHQTVTREGIE